MMIIDENKLHEIPIEDIASFLQNSTDYIGIKYINGVEDVDISRFIKRVWEFSANRLLEQEAEISFWKDMYNNLVSMNKIKDILKGE